MAYLDIIIYIILSLLLFKKNQFQKFALNILSILVSLIFSFIIFSIIYFIIMIKLLNFILIISPLFIVINYFMFKKIKKYLVMLKKTSKKITIDKIDKMTGREFEIYLEKLFCDLGYKTILHKGVADYGVDLIIQKNNCKIAVQAKRYSNKVNLKAVQEVHSGKNFYACHKSMVITNSYFQNSAIELAKSINCILVNRNDLINLIDKTCEKYYLIPYTFCCFLIFYMYNIILY